MAPGQISRPEAEGPVVHDGVVTVGQHSEVEEDGVQLMRPVLPAAAGRWVGIVVVGGEMDVPVRTADVPLGPRRVVCGDHKEQLWKGIGWENQAEDNEV